MDADGRTRLRKTAFVAGLFVLLGAGCRTTTDTPPVQLSEINTPSVSVQEPAVPKESKEEKTFPQDARPSVNLDIRDVCGPLGEIKALTGDALWSAFDEALTTQKQEGWKLERVCLRNEIVANEIVRVVYFSSWLSSETRLGFWPLSAAQVKSGVVPALSTNTIHISPDSAGLLSLDLSIVRNGSASVQYLVTGRLRGGDLGNGWYATYAFDPNKKTTKKIRSCHHLIDINTGKDITNTCKNYF